MGDMEITRLSGQSGKIAFYHTKFFMNHAMSEEGEWDPRGAPLRAANDFIRAQVWPDHQGDLLPAQLKAIARVNRAFHRDEVILKVRDGAKYYLRPGSRYEEWADWFGDHFAELKGGERVGVDLDLSRPLLISEDDPVPPEVWGEIIQRWKKGELFYVVCDVERTKRPSKARTWSQLVDAQGLGDGDE